MLKLKSELFKVCVYRHDEPVGEAHESGIEQSEDYVSPLSHTFENIIGILPKFIFSSLVIQCKWIIKSVLVFSIQCVRLLV